MTKLVKPGKFALILLVVVAVTLLAARAYQSQRGAPLEPWHTYVPRELHARELDSADWSKYLKAEGELFEALRAEVTQRLPPRKTQTCQPSPNQVPPRHFCGFRRPRQPHWLYGARREHCLVGLVLDYLIDCSN